MERMEENQKNKTDKNQAKIGDAYLCDFVYHGPRKKIIELTIEREQTHGKRGCERNEADRRHTG